ncbi:putative quinol monooxygenase [Variovorax sp. YR216]|uniref:putative quinol monooxygenase n=1 Tax=Variovorax sp. YR216 TaxID=1882828 RepID=UPI00089BA756|nr:antibiotic biosynthesis monooxygenase [Variovorax sp. YR216]SEB25993.1 Quinol monooxygenase YgiN [Variovorax sp. YR216]
MNDPAASTSTARVSFIVYLPVKPEARERMREMMFEVLEAMSAEPDFINTWAHEDLDDPNLIVNYETWACTREEFLSRHLAKPYRQPLEAALPELLSGPRRIVFLKPLRGFAPQGQG